MKFPRLTKFRWLLISGLVALYVSSYVWVRARHILIHRESYITEADGRRNIHIITTGDFGPGMLQGPVLPLIETSSFYFFTPLRWLESLARGVVSSSEPRDTGRLDKIKLGMSIDEVQAIFPDCPASETKLDLGDDPSEDQKRTKGFYAMHLDAEEKILVFNYYKTLIKVRNK